MIVRIPPTPDLRHSSSQPLNVGIHVCHTLKPKTQVGNLLRNAALLIDSVQLGRGAMICQAVSTMTMVLPLSLSGAPA